MPVNNSVQLITYPDSLGGGLGELHQVLGRHFDGMFDGGIHILPPFPTSGDRGFAPLTYLEIDPSFGDWEDVRRIGETHDILVDLMVNHISGQSAYFRDFLEKGKSSEYADLFITFDKIWPGGQPVQQDIDRMFLRRRVPYSTFPLGTGNGEISVWTTFGKQEPSEQIDIDVKSGIGMKFLNEVMTAFSQNSIKIVRLDAVGYVAKKPGTSCFFVEPDVYDFLEWISELAHSLGLELLPEVHSHYSTQFKLAESGYWIYDFILPFLILQALIKHSGSRLLEYLQVRPHGQFTMLDCHDGIPVKPDLDDLVPTADAQHIVDECIKRGANLSRVYSDKHKSPDGFDVHQIRCSYYSMLDCNDDAYLTARAIQFFTPGIPQVYYVGLLAGENDMDLMNRTGEGRDINRHDFTLEEIETQVGKPVVQRLMKLIRFRNTYPAFQGEFSLEQTSDSEFMMHWENMGHRCSLAVDLIRNYCHIHYLEKNRTKLLEV